MSELEHVEIPRLKVAECLPVTGPHWSNMSYEHRVQAGGSDWNHITPNGSTSNEPSLHSNQYIKAAMERRAALQQAVSGEGVDLSNAKSMFTKLDKMAEELEGVGWDDLAVSTSGLRQQIQERRQETLISKVDELDDLLEQDKGTIGVLLLKTYRERLMTRLGGFFVEAPESSGHGIARLGLTLVGQDGETTGAVPTKYTVVGLYLRA